MNRIEDEFKLPEMILDPDLDFEDCLVYQKELVSVKEDVAEGLGRASHATSYDDMTNPGFIQPPVVQLSEGSSQDEWGFKLVEHKRFASSNSLSTHAQVS